MIPVEAVEAAWDKLHENPIRPIGIDYAELEAALEAAAPHMLTGADPRLDAVAQLADEWDAMAIGATRFDSALKVSKPKHQCEPWQIQVNASGTFRYCAACGEPQP